jgi:hypothetical protein
MTDKSRFRNNFTITKCGCWNWNGSEESNTYGRCRYKGNFCLSHRVSYLLYVGPITKGLKVLHKCNNKKCVNPEHLYLGTAYDNVQDSIDAGTHFSLNHSDLSDFKSGENHPLAKLNNEDVICIKKMLRDNIDKKLICRIYKIGKSTLQNIFSGKTWSTMILN